MANQAFLDGNPYEIRAKESILSFVRRNLGEEVVPYLCHEDRLKPCGSCRVCSVEIASSPGGLPRVVASCHTEVIKDLHITTNSSSIKKLRKTLMEMVLADYPKEELGTENHKRPTHLQKMARLIGVSSSRFPASKSDLQKQSDTTHPYIKSDFSECIDCNRCVRACDEIQGQFVYSTQNRGFESRIVKGTDQSFLQSDCVSCGACVELCPTDAIFDRYFSKTVTPEKTTQTTCTYCGVGCSLKVHSSGDKVLAIESVDHTCLKGRYAFEFHRHPDRLKSPLIRKNGELVPARWEEAYDLIYSRFSEIKRLHGAHALAGISSARATNEENYLMQKFMRAVIGTNNIDGCARVCHAPTAFGMQKTFGTGAATNSFNDVKNANCILIVGANVTDAHPVVGAKIKQEVYKGKKLIVIDPRRIELAEMADVHLQLKPGTNIPLLSLFAYYLLKHKYVDLDFIKTRTEDFDMFKIYLLGLDLNKMSEECGVSLDLIEKAAVLYGKSERAMSFHGLGVTEHFQGSQTVMLLSCIAMMTGNIGKPGVGVNPLRGQNNVQGMADMGVQPHQGAGYFDVLDPAARAHYKKHYGVDTPTDVGLKLPEMLSAAIAKDLKALWLVGEDIMQTDPDSKNVGAALDSLDFLIVQEMFLTETAKKADVVLPIACFFEKDGTFTNGERRVQRVNKIFEPPNGVKTDGEVIFDMMKRFDFDQSEWEGPQVLKEVSQVVPFFSGANWENLEGQGQQWPIAEGGIGTPILHKDSFKRGLGKFFSFQYKPSPEMKNLSEYPFILTTGRELEHYNCGSMTRRTPNIELLSEDVLYVNRQDADKKGVLSGDRVEVSSPRGKTHLKAFVSDEVRPGVLYTTFHFPEVAINHLTGCVGDLETLTPEYKVIAVDFFKA